MKKIGVLTSGGDAPGMNAAIRAVVRSALSSGLTVEGVRDGYLGLTENRLYALQRASVSDVINRGGTFLGSARFPDFQQPEVQQQVVHRLQQQGIDGMVVIGGDGSYRGAQALSTAGVPCIALPGTIDNDIIGTDYTIGYHTALQTVLTAIDQLRDTSSSHRRISIIEVMGRYCGDLTLAAAIAGGCEFILLPGQPLDQPALIKAIQTAIQRGKKHALVAMTENICNPHQLAQAIEQQLGRETRATILGHIQRGGAPVGFDRLLASRMGCYAVELLQQGVSGHAVGVQNDQLWHYPLSHAWHQKKPYFKPEWLAMANQLF